MENAITVALELGSQGVTVARDPTGTRRGGQSSMWGQCPFFDSLPILTCKFHCPPIDNRMPAHPAPGSVSQSAPKSSDSVPGSGFGSGSGNQSARKPAESSPSNREPINTNRSPRTESQRTRTGNQSACESQRTRTGNQSAWTIGPGISRPSISQASRTGNQSTSIEALGQSTIVQPSYDVVVASGSLPASTFSIICVQASSSVITYDTPPMVFVREGTCAE